MNGPVDFFLSYTSADKAWAEWIAGTLKGAGFTSRAQCLDFRPGNNFVLEMHEAAKVCARTMPLYSPEYFAALYTHPEWAAAFAGDPTGKDRKLVPARIRECQPDGILKAVIYINLVGLSEPEAKQALLDGVHDLPPLNLVFPGAKAAASAGQASPASAKPPPFPGTPVSGKPCLHNLPFAPNPFFTDGLNLLPQLRSALDRQSAAALTQPQAVHGLGGVGKTQLAIECAWRHQADYDAVLWTGAASKAELQANLAALARLLSLPEAAATEQAVQFQAVLDWLRAHERWLLILDNADTAEAAAAVQQLLPPGLRGHVIVTSRRADWPVSFADLEVRVLPEAVAAAFLRARAGKSGFDPGPDADARAVARELGGLPLALEQAGAYLARHRLNFAGYLELLKTSRANLLAFPALGGTGHHGTVATTWLVNEPHLSATARAVLQIAAFLAPDDIPRALFEQGGKILAEAAELSGSAAFTPLLRRIRRWLSSVKRCERRAPTAEVSAALAELADLSLVELEPGGFGCHRLLQAVLLDRLAPAARKSWGQLAVRLVSAYDPGDPGDVRTWPVWDPLRPHASALLQALGDDADTEAGTLANQLAVLLYAKALYSESGMVMRRALAIDERNFGPEHPNVAIRLNNLASLLQATDRLEEAEPLMRRALALNERSFGPEHPNVAINLNNLAGLLQATDRLAEAEPLLRRALAIHERSFGPEHPDFARNLNNLALLLKATDRLAEAEPLYRRALAIWEKSLGENHPDVASVLNNLALLLQATDRLAEAEPLMRRALAIHERSFGPEHPNVARGLNNLAHLLQATEQLAEAEPLMRRVVAIFEKSLGENHPNVATAINNLAALLQATGRLAEAEPLMRRALAIHERSFGEEHPDFALSLWSLANLFSVTNRRAEADPMLRRAAAIYLHSLGPEHPDTKNVLGHYQSLLTALKLPAAEMAARLRSLTTP